MVIWITGLSGAGKTTVGRHLYNMCRDHDPATVFLDGDEIRRIFRHDKGNEPYSVHGRRKNAERITELCAWLDRQNINVICCILSIFQDMRDSNRENFSRYFEVYLDAPMSVLSERRTLYSDAKQGAITNVVGVDIPFTEPSHPDLVASTGPGGETVESIAARIFSQTLVGELG